ncbi:uncharacterized protein si:dkey-92i15.4 isoform X2 [Colossoma macropomum]|uniref:uncharacterized protein si:dkey-92i15.4 isoform X2 n=1 Tax=Colossoma macropomum TaxID=42526 RepID=UPI001863C545|nr:uncharacterized protein si:dkey-92i15.4 isoform X2 [Colossoma macropomum]
MEMSAGSTVVPEYSASASGHNGPGNAELSNGSEEGQGKSSVAQMRSTSARFRIRSAKDRMLEPTKGLKTGSRFEGEAIVSRGSNNSGKEVPRVCPHSPPSPDSVINERTPRALNQVSVAKDPELPSELSDATQGKPDCAGSLTTTVRGRTEWRGANLTNRSKSLDWRGSDRGMIRNTSDFKRSPRIRSESFEETGNSPNSKEPPSPSSRVSLRIQAFNAIGQGKQDSTDNFSPVVSGSSSVRTGRVALALERATGGQSLPSRLKLKESQDITEDRKSPWWNSGQSSPKPDQAEVQLRSQVSGSKVSEITGNKSIQDRIGKLYGLNASEERIDANSRDSIAAKRYSAPVGDWFSSLDATDSNSVHKRSTNDTMVRVPSSSSFSQWRRASYDTEKGATFPRKSKKDGIDFMSSTDTPSVSPNWNVRKDPLSNTPVPPGSASSKERPLDEHSTHLLSGSSEWKGESMVLGTNSLDRARGRKSVPARLSVLTTESSFLGCELSPPSEAAHPTRHETIGKEMEKDRHGEKTTDNLTHVKAAETSQRNEEIHLFGQSKPQFSRSMTVDGEKYKGSEDEFKFGSLTIPRMKKEGSQEKAQVPSFDSVRNTIHKFEALAQQNKTPSKTLGPRRTFSVPEKPKFVPLVTKSSSDKSLDNWKGFWNTRSLKEKVQGEVVSPPVLSRPAQTTAINTEGLTMKTQSTVGSRQELLDTFASEQSNEAKDDVKDDMKINVMNRHMDEPDFSKAGQQNMKNVDSTEEKVRNNLNAAASQKSSGATDASHPDLSQSKCSLDANDRANLQTQELPPSNARTKDAKAFQTSESTNDSVSSTSVKPALLLTNNTHSKAASSNGGSTEPAPVEVISSAPSALNNICRDEKVAAKISRWISYEGDDVKASAADDDDDDDDDEDDEGTEKADDSDSGESSVTITSNMSQSDNRSFSVSLVDLCNLGGLDYPASDGNGSNDEEKWMSRRSASLSSDISVLSSVTLLGTEELDCLLNDVRGLGNDTLQNCEDVQVVVLHKEVGRGLGFTVAGGVDQNKPVTVHRVFPCGAAGQEGSIQEGDQVLSINGTALHNSAHWEALRTLRRARGRGMAVVVLRRGNIAETQHGTKDGLQQPAGKPAGSRVRVTLTKSSADLGFSLEGGVGSSLGDKPLTVQRLFQGGPVGKLCPGDELLEIEGQSLGGLRRLEAWNLIKKLPPGPVEVLLHRPHLPH